MKSDLELQHKNNLTLELTDEDIARMKMVEYFRRNLEEPVGPGDLELIDLPPHVKLMKNQIAYTYRIKIRNVTINKTIIFRNGKIGESVSKQTGEIMTIHEQ